MSFKRSERGVCVQASSLGSLEALLEFLKESDIPVGAINIGPVRLWNIPSQRVKVTKKDVMKASAMGTYGRQYACVLAFDVPVAKSAEGFQTCIGDFKLFSCGAANASPNLSSGHNIPSFQ